METDKDSYHRRVFGFISEFLLLVWVRVNNIKVKECKVGMVGEKAETRELKAVLSSFLTKEDTKGAMQYFMDFYNKRPDVLMEASDVTGELHLMLQITAVMDMQIKREGGSFYKSNPDVRKWFGVFSDINRKTQLELKGQLTEDWKEMYREMGIPEEAFAVARKLYGNK